MMDLSIAAPEKGMCNSHQAALTLRSTSPQRPKSEFPTKLYAILELADKIPEVAEAITWLPHGRAFAIRNKDTFMKEVVPLFFNQTQIRSFNRQLHLWGFHRIGGRNETVWYHNDFLRGVPESMKRLFRTKIKGNTVASSDDGTIPNFDDLPPLPICKQPSNNVLAEMGKAILKMHNQRISSIAPRDSTVPPAPLHARSNDAAVQLTVSPRSESPFKFSVGFNPKEPSVLPPSYLPTSDASQGVTFMMPLQVGTSESIASTNQTSFEGTSCKVQSHIMPQAQAESNDVSFSPLKHNNEDLEPLPFSVDNDPFDDFANFIEGAIQPVEVHEQTTAIADSQLWKV